MSTSLIIGERRVQDVTVLELRGRIIFDSGGMLEGMVLRCLHRGDRKFVLDMTELVSVDSSGLGEILQATNRVELSGGRLLISQPWRATEDLFSITHITTLLRRVNSIAELLPEFADEPLFSRCARCGFTLSLYLLRQYQLCGRCGLELKLSVPERVEEHLEITVARLTAYADEHIKMWPNTRPVAIELSGRLDLAAAELVAELSAMAGGDGERVVLTTTGERTPAGWRTLSRLPVKVTVVVGDLEAEEQGYIPKNLTVTHIRPSAGLVIGSLMIPVRRASKD